MKKCLDCSELLPVDAFITNKSPSCFNCIVRARKARKSAAEKKLQHSRYVSRLYQKHRRQNPIHRAIHNARNRIYMALKFGIGKKATSKQYLGCDWEILISHIESKFKPGMSWANYGMFGWHLDHIKPISAFDPKEIEKSFHYMNLQPLWCHENWSKNDKFDVQVKNTL
jgi:hypothetical protein